MNIIIDLATNTIHVDGEAKLSELIDKIKNVYELDPESFSISTNPPSGYVKQPQLTITSPYIPIGEGGIWPTNDFKGCSPACADKVCHCVGPYMNGNGNIKYSTDTTCTKEI